MKYKLLDWEFLFIFLFFDQYMIVMVGQDGLVVNIVKYVVNCLIVVVNFDKECIDGILLLFSV